jgi:hypothetical protein
MEFVNEKIAKHNDFYLMEAIEDFKKSERNKDIVWIRDNKELLSIAAIEKVAGLPETSLLKAVNGGQKFPKKWEKKLSEFVKKLKE